MYWRFIRRSSAVGPALQRQVKVRHDLRVVAQDGDQLRRQVARLEAREPQAAQAGHARAQRVDQSAERLRAVSHGCRRRSAVGWP